MTDVTVEAVTVEADYRRVDGGWSTRVTAPQLGVRMVSGAQLGEVFEAVLAASTDAAGRLGTNCRTVHRLDGETTALAALATERGLATAATDAGSGPVVTLSSPVPTDAGRPARRARCPYAPRS